MGDNIDGKIHRQILEDLKEFLGEKELEALEKEKEEVEEQEEVGVKPSLAESDFDSVVNEVSSLIPPLDLKDWRIIGLVEKAVCVGSIQGLFLLKLKGVQFRSLRLPSGDSLMHRAASTGQTESILFLYREGLCVDNRNHYWNITPLHVAASNDQVNALRLLLLLGAEIDAEDSRKRTALHHAMASNSYRAATFLVLAGASLTKKDKMGHTPHTMCLNSICPSFKVFLEQAIIHASSCWYCRQVVDDNVIN